MGWDALHIQQQSTSVFVGVYHQHQGNDRFCFSDLLANKASRTYSIPHVSGVAAQGTPSFRWIRYNGNPDKMTVEIGFHQNRNGRDVNAIGFLRGFRSFDSYLDANLNGLVSKFAQGHIGDRDFLFFNGRPYTVIEAMTAKDNWQSWRLFLHDEVANKLTPIDFHNGAGARSFGNASLAFIQAGAGKLELVMSNFVFGPASGAGQHLFSTPVPTGSGAPIQAVTDLFSRTWDARGLSHRFGYVDGDGWASAAGEVGHMIYGPYEKNLPHAPLQAQFEIQVDNNTANNANIVRVEIHDATTGEIVAYRDVRRQDFTAPFKYQTFKLNFDWRYRNTHSLETRVHSYGASYVKFRNIKVVEGI